MPGSESISAACHVRSDTVKEFVVRIFAVEIEIDHWSHRSMQIANVSKVYYCHQFCPVQGIKDKELSTILDYVALYRGLPGFEFHRGNEEKIEASRPCKVKGCSQGGEGGLILQQISKHTLHMQPHF